MTTVGVYLFLVIAILTTVICLPVPYEQPADAATLVKTGPNNPARTAVPVESTHSSQVKDGLADSKTKYGAPVGTSARQNSKTAVDASSKTKASAGSKAKFGVLSSASTIEQPPVDQVPNQPWSAVVQDTEPAVENTEPVVEVAQPVEVENTEPAVEMDQPALQNTAAVADVVAETEIVDNASSVDENQSVNETILVNATQADVDNGTVTAPNVTESIDDFIDQLENLTNENQTDGLNVTANEFNSTNSTGVQVNAADPDCTYNATGIYMNSANSSFGFVAEGIEINSTVDDGGQNGTESNSTSAIGIGIIIVSTEEGMIDFNSTSNSTSLGNSTTDGVNTTAANATGYGFVVDNSAPDLNNTLIVNSTTVNATSAPGVNSTAGVGFSVNATSETSTTMAPIVNGTAIPIVNSTTIGLMGINTTDVPTTTPQNVTQTVVGEVTTTGMTTPAPNATDVPVI